MSEKIYPISAEHLSEIFSNNKFIKNIKNLGNPNNKREKAFKVFQSLYDSTYFITDVGEGERDSTFGTVLGYLTNNTFEHNTYSLLSLHSHTYSIIPSIAEQGKGDLLALAAERQDARITHNIDIRPIEAIINNFNILLIQEKTKEPIKSIILEEYNDLFQDLIEIENIVKSLEQTALYNSAHFIFEDLCNINVQMFKKFEFVPKLL